jgi:hypothetical protein
MFGNTKPNLKTMIHLFDHTLKAVLLYGGEIWRTFIGKKLREGNDNFISKLFSNLKQEHTCPPGILQIHIRSRETVNTISHTGRIRQVSTIH